MFKQIFAIALIIASISCTIHSTDVKTLIMDTTTGQWYIQEAESQTFVRSYLSQIPKDGNFLMVEEIEYTGQLTKVYFDHFLAMGLRYRDELKKEAKMIVMINRPTETGFKTQVLVYGSTEDIFSIQNLRENYKNAEFAFTISDILKMTNIHANEIIGLEKIQINAMDDFTEMALWLILLIIFGPIIIVVFIVFTCFKWCCRPGMRSAPLLV